MLGTRGASPGVPRTITYSTPIKLGKSCRSRPFVSNAARSIITAVLQWGRSPEGARNDVCPACRRINDELPAGIVKLHGPVARQRKPEIVSLARHEEAAERAGHPLNRIIGIDDTEDGLAISTTDIHLPRRIGTALKRAMHGTLDMHFDNAGYFVRVDWRPIA
jgi:hypothetical protein